MVDLINTDACPYGCSNGKLFDSQLHTLVPCPHCSKVLKAIATGKEVAEDGRSIKEILCIPRNYTGVSYDFSVTVPDSSLITLESISSIESLLEGLLNKVTLGELPLFSCFINLGRNADILNFIFSYLIASFKSGLITSPLISSTDIVALRNLAEGTESAEYRSIKDHLGCSYFDLERSDVCVITLDASITTNGVYAVKGLLEGRSRRGLPTLVFTNAMLNQSQKSLILTEYSKCLHLLTPYEVQYKRSVLNSEVTADDSNVNLIQPVNPTPTISQEELYKLYNTGNNDLV